jgi:Carboxypeptidase regulatory-like domain/FlgD Ig-like domain
MKNLFVILTIFAVFIISAEVIIEEDFSGTFPPDGWSIDGGTNWGQETSSNAGGVEPEATFNWSPSTTGTQSLRSAPVNTVGASELDLEFKHLINDYNGDYEIRLESSSDGVNWNVIQVFPSASIPATTENIVVTSPDVGSATFQLAWIFDGNSFNINYWYIDDVLLEGTLITYDNDLAGMEINGNTIVNAGNSEIYEISVKNVGYNTQTGYNVKLFKDNTEVASLDVADSIEPDETVVHNLVWQIPADEPAGVRSLHGLITLDGDENTTNDLTNTLQATVMPPGITQIHVGDGTILWNRAPVRFQYLNSLSEMLFFPDELEFTTGTIVGLTFYTNFIHNWPNENVAIWLGETTLENLTDGFIPSTQLTSVFDGDVTFPLGENEVTITLNTPYFYNGGNLVMMVHRPMSSSQNGDDNFYCTETLDHIDRTIYDADDLVVFNPALPPTLFYGAENFPNTTFSFFMGEMGEVEGYVYDEMGTPLDNAEVEIEELQMVTYSDDQGFYHFGNVLTGTYDFTANKFGYSPQTIQAEVLEEQTTTIDFNLPPLDIVDVMGHVEGSDFPTIGLNGATVVLSGFEYYEVQTDNLGDFIINGVYTNITYDLIVTFDGYNTLYDEAVVEGVDLDVGTLVLEEMSFPPGNVQATQNTMQTEVDLSWNSPGQGGGEFRYDDGIVDFEIGFSDAPTNGVFGAVHPNIAIIQEVQWYLTSTYGTHNSVKILILGLDEENLPDVEQVYLITNLIDNVDDEWNSLILEEEINASEGFFVGVITPGQYTSIALDDGVDEPWIFQSGTQMSNENWLAGNNWSDIGDVGSIFQKNMMIRAYGINMGYTIPDSSMPTLAIPSPDNNRVFESYNIYRFPFILHNTPESWDLVASTVTDTFYLDTSWAALPADTYQFAITSIHSNGIESIPAYSQSLDKIITDAEPDELPVLAELYSNHPNPFNPATSISFSTTDNAVLTELTIFNIQGQKVKTLVNDILSIGIHSITWNGKNDAGKDVASGLYFYKLTTGDFSSTKKMLLLK